MDYESTINDNIIARSGNPRKASAERVAITNVRVFDGSRLQPPSTVIIDGARIGRPCDAREACVPTTTFDAHGMTLLPGLIDSHAHPSNVTHMAALARFGVTAAVNAFCPAPALCASLRDHPGLPSLVTASFIATAPGSVHAKLVGPENAGQLINGTDDAAAFVARQVAQGADFIKIVGSAPLPGLSQEEQIALVQASRAAGKLTVLHTASSIAYAQGLVAGADQIHHAPLDVAVDDKLAGLLKEQGTVVCPTLTMMRAIVDLRMSPNSSFAPASETVTALHKAGVAILAGTDANLQPGTPANVAFGSSLHDELENLVEAGLSPVEALNAATVLPAKHFSLTDRGAIREGMMADLVLVDGDPTADIAATRNIVKVWVRGVEIAI